MSRFPIPSYSHSGEDRLIWKLFGYRREGTYVDVGCYHPSDYSNTYLLYQAGWRGLVIDADDYFLPLYWQMRPRDKVRHVAVSSEAGEATLYTFQDRSLNTLDDVTARTDVAPAGTLRVRVERLDTLLREEAIGSVDLVNIDVEGRDLAVLRSHDWNIRPRIIAIEDHTLDLSDVSASATYRFLSGIGYKLHSKCNYTAVYETPT